MDKEKFNEYEYDMNKENFSRYENKNISIRTLPDPLTTLL
jgi:hypothetical protein